MFVFYWKCGDVYTFKIQYNLINKIQFANENIIISKIFMGN